MDVPAAKAGPPAKPERVKMLEGADEIGEFLGLPPHRIYKLAESKSLPVFKLRGKLYARPQSLLQAIERLEAEAPDAA